MKYIENFIDPKYQVPLDFDSLITETSTSEQKTPFYHTIISIVVCVLLMYCIFKTWWTTSIILALFFLFAAPFSYKWIQHKMGIYFPYKFTWIVFVIFSSLIFVFMVINNQVEMNQALALEKQKEQIRIESEKKKIEEQVAREKEIQLEQEEAQRLADSLNYHKNIADDYYKKKLYAKALFEYESALSFTGKIYHPEVLLNIATIYFTQKKYQEALNYYQKLPLPPIYSSNDTLAYQKAICFKNIGNIREAVNAIKASPRSKRTDILFNQINPEKTKVVYKDTPVKKKKISYYATICRDGSEYFGNSRRGACSRRGGVASWSSPVYETYEVMEKKKYYEKYREYGER
ncbi:hypothetical protein [Fibrobacter sp.]